jgi:predicted RNase H-like HicB family nuclease
MRYTVILEPTKEPDQPGWYYAHIPALDLTTHGIGPEGAMDAARDLVLGWITELRSRGEEIPVERPGFIGQIEISDDAIHAA